MFFLLITLTGCAEVTKIKNKNIKDYFSKLIKEHNNIQEVTMELSDVTLHITFECGEGIGFESIRELFDETRNYILDENTQNLIMKDVKNSYYYRHHSKAHTNKIHIDFMIDDNSYTFSTNDFGRVWKLNSWIDGKYFSEIEIIEY